MYFQEEVGEHEDGNLLIKHFVSGEPAQKRVRFEEGSVQVQDQGYVICAARIRKRTAFIEKYKPQKKTGGLKGKIQGRSRLSKNLASMKKAAISSTAVQGHQQEISSVKLQMETLTS